MITLSLIYFLPTIVALLRGHRLGGILVLNFFFGWTGIGWLALMLWALLSRPCVYVVPGPVFYPYSGWRRY